MENNPNHWTRLRIDRKNGSLLLFHSISSIDSPARPLITEGKSAVTIIRGSLSANWRARRFRSGCTFFELESRLIAPSCKLNTRIRVSLRRGAHSSQAFHWLLFTPTSLKLTNRSSDSSWLSRDFLLERRFQTSSFKKKFLLWERKRERERVVFSINYPL